MVAGATREDTLHIHFLTGGEQPATETARRVAAFVAGARRSLDFALYDLRLSPPITAIIAGALAERAAAGVRVRIAYDADKPEPPEPPATARGGDPAPGGTGASVRRLGYLYRRIGGPKLMHHKYILRDAPDFADDDTPAASSLSSAAVWTGSANFTDDAWALQENNILMLAAPVVVREYARDFAALWREGEIGESGDFDTAPTTLTYEGQPVAIRVLFAPGRGPEIDERVAAIVAGARRRVRVCSMLLNSGTLLNALRNQLDAGRVPVDGIYDRTQMADVLPQWADIPSNVWKIAAVRDVVRRARLVGKRSTRYAPTTPHDFLHMKVLVVDDMVITGSYNFSRSAMKNAENILFLTNAALADHYAAHIARLMAKYRHESEGEL